MKRQKSLKVSIAHQPILVIDQQEDKKDRKTERQKDRKTERQKDRKTERQKDRKTGRQKDSLSSCLRK